MSDRGIGVEVVWATPAGQWVRTVRLTSHATALEALQASGLLHEHPEAASLPAGVGVWGRPVPPDHPLQDGDRVEIYRPLQADPKEARRARSKRRAAGRG